MLEPITLNGANDPRIAIPDRGDAKIAYQDKNDPDLGWIEDELDPEQQRVLNEYAAIAGKAMRNLIGHMEDEKNTEEEYERELAENGLNPDKQPKFQELLHRTLVMSQSATGDLKLMEELILDNQKVKEDLAAMEAAFHCLAAAALITGTEWEPL